MIAVDDPTAEPDAYEGIEPDRFSTDAAPERDAQLVPLLISLAKTVRRLIGVQLEAHGVLPGQDQMLTSLRDDETASIRVLAERMSVRASTVSKMVFILERKGWVGRRPDTGDARRVVVRLTAEGRRMRRTVHAVHSHLEADLRRSLESGEDVAPVLTRLDAVLSSRLARLR